MSITEYHIEFNNSTEYTFVIGKEIDVINIIFVHKTRLFRNKCVYKNTISCIFLGPNPDTTGKIVGQEMGQLISKFAVIMWDTDIKNFAASH